MRRPDKLALFAALFLGTLAWISPSIAGAAEYVVKPGDTLWKIAQDHGCTVDQLRTNNGLEDDDALRVNLHLDLSPCAKKPSSSARPSSRGYMVRRGDSLARIAQKHGTSVSELRRLNKMASNMIHPGQRLEVPGKAQPPIRVVAGQSVGRPTKGKLVDGTQLGRDPGYYRRRLERTYGASHVVDQVRRAVRDTRDLHPKLHRLAIGDLSHEHGGWLSGHKSHQSGRDIDLGLYFRRVPAGYPQEFVDAETGGLDATATWDLVAALAATADQSGGVDRIFLDYAVQGKLYEAARAKGVSKKKLGDVFQYPDGKYAKHGIVRHEPAHSDHLHVRFKCPEKDASCR